MAKHKFGVLHVHDLKKTMAKKGVEFERECRIFEWSFPGLVDGGSPHCEAASKASGLMPPRWVWRRVGL